MKKLLALLSILLMFTCVQAANFAQPLDGLGDEVVLSDYSQGEVFEQPTNIEWLTFEPLGNEIYPSLPLLAVQTEGHKLENTIRQNPKLRCYYLTYSNYPRLMNGFYSRYYYEWGLSSKRNLTYRT